MLSLQRVKCTVIGNYGVGKTSLIHRFLNMEPKHTKSTVGIDFFMKTIKVYDEQVRVSIWDTAGAERFHSLTHSYLRDSSIIFIVYDLGNIHFLRNIKMWLQTIEECRVQPVVICVLGNKSDIHETPKKSLKEALEPYKRQNWTIFSGITNYKDSTFREYLIKSLKHVIGKTFIQKEPVAPVINISIQTPSQRTCCT